MKKLTDSQAALLTHQGWLSLTPGDFQQELTDVCLCYEREAGRAITHGGEVSGGIFGLVEGTARVFSAVGSHDGALLHIAGPAFWFGLFPISSGRPRIMSVTAQTPCVVANVPQASLQKIIDRRAETWRWLSLLSLESAALAVQALADVLIADKERRCAASLLRAAGCRDYGNQPAVAVLTQDDLAALSNVSRPTANTVVRRLAAKGFITPGYRSIAIHTPDQLRRFVDLRN